MPLYLENCGKSLNCSSICLGISYILYFFANTIEALTFLLVINMMLPLTNSQRMCLLELNLFFLNGFASFENLEQAVLEENKNMDTEE